MYTLLIVQMAVSGALMGLVYALIAYGFQLTFATSKSINFGQGELVMLSAFFSLTLIDLGLPYWLVVPGGLLFGVVLGLFVERAGRAPGTGAEERGLDPPHHHPRPVGLLRCGKHLGPGRPSLPHPHFLRPAAVFRHRRHPAGDSPSPSACSR